MKSILCILLNQTFWTAVSAIGTIIVACIALFPRREREKLNCWYWIIGTYIRVCVENNSKFNCVLEKDSYLIITMGGNGELKTKPLQMKEFIPAYSTCNINYVLDETTYNLIKAGAKISLFLFTKKGTVVKLKKGFTGEPEPIKFIKK